jgi:hypothetical protein
MADTGRHPRMGFEPQQPRSKLELVNEFADRMALGIVRDIHLFPYFPYPPPLSPYPYVLPIFTSVSFPRTVPIADDLQA